MLCCYFVWIDQRIQVEAKYCRLPAISDNRPVKPVFLNIFGVISINVGERGIFTQGRLLLQIRMLKNGGRLEYNELDGASYTFKKLCGLNSGYCVCGGYG